MKKHLLYRLTLTALLLGTLLSVAAVCGVLARYTTKITGKPGIAGAQEMFFECDYEDGGLYLIPANGDAFTFTVRNYDFLDNYSQSDITYSVTLDGILIVTNAKLNGGNKFDDPTNISASSLAVGSTYTISITATEPYEKTISFRISVVDDFIDNYYSVKDYGNWVQLDLYVGTTAPTALEVNYEGLAPDSTHDLMRTWMTGDNQNALVGLQSYSHYTLIFFGDKDVANVEKTELPTGIITLN
ncbi:MAG: hypothetical protein E7644_06680 [Ruminococcaceae bacterium]|nr:hypothetical protein [Oscillospiraceae bacterium]